MFRAHPHTQFTKTLPQIHPRRQALLSLKRQTQGFHSFKEALFQNSQKPAAGGLTLMNSGGSGPWDAHEHGVHLQACVLPSEPQLCCPSATASRSHPLVSEQAAARLRTLEIPACITYPLPCHCGETSHSSGTKPPPVSETEHTAKHARSSPCPGPVSCKSWVSKMSLEGQKVQELHRLMEMDVWSPQPLAVPFPVRFSHCCICWAAGEKQHTGCIFTDNIWFSSNNLLVFPLNDTLLYLFAFQASKLTRHIQQLTPERFADVSSIW